MQERVTPMFRIDETGEKLLNGYENKENEPSALEKRSAREDKNRAGI